MADIEPTVLPDHPHDRLLTSLMEDHDRLRALHAALDEYVETLDSRDRARDLIAMVGRIDSMPIDEIRDRLGSHRSGIWDAEASPSFITYAPQDFAPRWAVS